MIVLHLSALLIAAMIFFTMVMVARIDPHRRAVATRVL
ncbi:hypothetical protein SAMN05880590_101877 [Rhizobium sp. RU35A]|nr:hypothetical protein SAMN05880590_101877 [Rhizobium sp. RU35A]